MKTNVLFIAGLFALTACGGEPPKPAEDSAVCQLFETRDCITVLGDKGTQECAYDAKSWETCVPNIDYGCQEIQPGIFNLKLTLQQKECPRILVSNQERTANMYIEAGDLFLKCGKNWDHTASHDPNFSCDIVEILKTVTVEDVIFGSLIIYVSCIPGYLGEWFLHNGKPCTDIYEFSATRKPEPVTVSGIVNSAVFHK